MNRYAHILICFLFFSIQGFCQKANVEQRIKNIKKEFLNINADSSKFKVVTKDVFGQSSQGGELRKYYLDSTLKKAILIFYGEIGKEEYDYYFLDGKIFFLYQCVFKYTKTIGVGENKIDKKEENRFYIYDNKLIRWIKNKKQSVNKNLFEKKQREILQDIKKYID